MNQNQSWFVRTIKTVCLCVQFPKNCERSEQTLKSPYGEKNFLGKFFVIASKMWIFCGKRNGKGKLKKGEKNQLNGEGNGAGCAGTGAGNCAARGRSGAGCAGTGVVWGAGCA